jgi:hypothetical protein
VSNQDFSEAETQPVSEDPSEAESITENSTAAPPRAQPVSTGAATRRGQWRRDLADLGARLRTFALILGAVLIDLGFVAIWAYVHHWFDELVLHRLQLVGVDWFSLAVFRIVFVGLTLYAVMLYVVKDAIRIFHRIWDE